MPIAPPPGSAASSPAGRSKSRSLAQAAKTARIAWAMLISGETYRAPAQPRGLMDNAARYPQAQPPPAAIVG